jgi:hypothetical protein
MAAEQIRSALVTFSQTFTYLYNNQQQLLVALGDKNMLLTALVQVCEELVDEIETLKLSVESAEIPE